MADRVTPAAIERCLELLTAEFPDLVERCRETPGNFDYETVPVTVDAASLQAGGDVLGDSFARLAALAEHAGLCSVRLYCTIDGGPQGILALRAAGKVAELAVERAFVKEPDYVDPGEPALDEIVSDLGAKGATTPPAELEARLRTLAELDLPVRLKLALFASKSDWRRDLFDDGDGTHRVLFLFPRKLREWLESSSLADFVDAKSPLIVAGRPTAVVVFGARGALGGGALSCFGLDRLERARGFARPPAEMERLGKLWSLCHDQCVRWEGKPEVLTPDHFTVQDRGFIDSDGEAPKVAAELETIAAQLAIVFLADATDGGGNPTESRFDAVRSCPVAVGRAELRSLLASSDVDAGPLLELYGYAYGSYSGDQLYVVRQLISGELEMKKKGNARCLLESAAKISETAKSRMGELMRRNIGEYFSARNRLIEFLRQYTRDVGDTITHLTDELISNLYKTVAAVVGAAVAAKLDQPGLVVLTAGLYFLYLLFILFYMMPAVVLKYRLKKTEHQHTVAHLVQKDVLMRSEIERFEGTAFRATERLFDRYYRATLRIYGLLALGALALTGLYFWIWL